MSLRAGVPGPGRVPRALIQRRLPDRSGRKRLEPQRSAARADRRQTAPEGWCETRNSTVFFGGSSSSFSSALAADRVHLVGAVHDHDAARRRPGGHGEEALDRARTSSTRMTVGQRLAVSSRGSAGSADQACRQVGLGQGPEAAGDGVVGIGCRGCRRAGGAKSAVARPPAVLPAGSARRARRSSPCPRPVGPVSSQPWGRRPELNAPRNVAFGTSA
jgi:hypothetical protein